MEVICHYCNGKAELVTGDIIYPHRTDLHSKKFWLCKPCDAYVGTYGDNRPFGILANKELRQKKRAAHKTFDPLWKSGHMTRSEAYEWLSKKLGVEKEHCHIGMFNTEMCNKVIEIVSLYTKTLGSYKK